MWIRYAHEMALTQTSPPPRTSVHPMGYTPDEKAVAPAPYLKKSVQSRPLPHSASRYTPHSRPAVFHILTPCAFPGMLHPTLFAPPPLLQSSSLLRSRSTNTLPKPSCDGSDGTWREGVASSSMLNTQKPLFCSIFTRACDTLHKPAHFHCYFPSLHHRLEVPGGFSPCLLRHTDGSMQQKRI